MSDVLLFRDLKLYPAVPRIERNGKIFVPNPGHAIEEGERLNVYLEIYNLKRDEFGQTAYEIAYRMGWSAPDEIDPSQFEALDLSVENPEEQADYSVKYLIPEKQRKGITAERVPREDQEETAVSVRYLGLSQDDFTYLHINVDRVPAGIHKLSLTIKDLKGEQTVERHVLFRILE